MKSASSHYARAFAGAMIYNLVAAFAAALLIFWIARQQKNATAHGKRAKFVCSRKPNSPARSS